MKNFKPSRVIKEILVLVFFVLAVAFVIVQILAPSWLPLFEKGHRLYGAPNREAAKVLQRIFVQKGHLVTDEAFEAGPTKQILFNDNTVIIVVEPDQKPKGLNLSDPMPSTSISLVSRNPKNDAAEVVGWLREAGFEAEVIEQPMEGLPDGSFAFVRSNAFENDHFLLVFRWWAFYLGGKPKPIQYP